MSKYLLDSGPSFFVLSTEYKKTQLDEILFLVKEGFTYSDILTMPIYLRRYYIQYIDELKTQK